jgi:alcohol dehydrogenase, propanol-preferring
MVVEKLCAPSKLTEMLEPTLRGSFEMPVKIRASRVCHTDQRTAYDDWSVKPILPFFPEHEGAGDVVKCGARVDGIAPSDRLADPWLHSACGQCQLCITSWEILSTFQKNTGYSVNSGYAERVVADSRHVGKTRDGLDYTSISPLLGTSIQDPIVGACRYVQAVFDIVSRSPVKREFTTARLEVVYDVFHKCGSDIHGRILMQPN